MQRQVIHDHVDPFVSWIRSPQAPERCQEIPNGLPFANCSGQTVLVYIVEAQELLGAGQSPVGCPQPVWMSSPGPVLPMNRSDLQRPPLVKTHENASSGGLMIQFENEVSFSRTPDPETLSRSCFSGARGLRASEAAGSTRC